MKAFCVIVALLLTGCSSIEPSFPTGRVVLDEHHTVTLAYWKPGGADIALMENALSVEFSRVRQSNPKRLPYLLSDYAITCYGDEISAKRVMIARGFHKSQRTLEELQHSNADPKRTVSLVYGGGALYFTMVYDVEKNRVDRFSINAPK